MPSISDKLTERGGSVLIVYGDEGELIQVYDDEMVLLGQGTERLKLPLEEGIFRVRWTSSRGAVQKLVRLLPIKKPLVVHRDEGAAFGEPKSDFAAASATLSANVEERVPELMDAESEIGVVLRARTDASAEDYRGDIQLFNSENIEVFAAGKSKTNLNRDRHRDKLVRVFRVEPGTYHLRYALLSGETGEQSVGALAGRRTICLLKPEAANVLVVANEGFVQQEKVGIVAASGIIFSVRTEDALAPGETLNLTSNILAGLAAGRVIIGPKFCRLLTYPRTDPLLRIFAAAAVISQLDANISPDPTEVWPADGDIQNRLRNKWAARAKAWIRLLVWLPGTPPDLVAILWRLGTQKIIDKRVVPALLEAPPMLACAWSWAVLQSLRHPNAIPDTLPFRAVGRIPGGTAPWLTWKTASAKGDMRIDTAPLPLNAAVKAVLDQVHKVLQAPVREASVERSRDPLYFLTDEAKAMANTALMTASTVASGDLRQVSESLAVNFGLPAKQLTRKLLATLSELNTFNAEETAGQSRSASAAFDAANASGGELPSPLKRQIKYPDDPIKGRFGKLPERLGFKLMARFKPTSSKDWVTLVLTVACPSDRALKDDTVLLALHDSFKPFLYYLPIKNGRARKQVTIWGGFTVGAWFENEKVALELDLTALQDAPRIVRTR